MNKKIVTLQDISCYGSCSITVAQPILAAMGIECALLPSAILSTHTSGFKNFTVLDLDSELPKIINHWKDEKIKYDAIYTGYISSVSQFDLIKDLKKNNLNHNGLLIVDPSMADKGHMYPALPKEIVSPMKSLSKEADVLLPNVSEACLLLNIEYKEHYTKEEYIALAKGLTFGTNKLVILTSVNIKDKLGCIVYQNGKYKFILKKKIEPSYHGTGDIFSSLIISGIMNNINIYKVVSKSEQFIIDSIKATKDDYEHSYGVHFEELLRKGRRI